VLGISTILKQSILQPMTSNLAMTFTVADTKSFSDDQGAPPNENRSEERNDLALSLGLGLGLFVVLLIMGGLYLFRMMCRSPDKDSSQEESEVEVEAPSNTGESLTGGDVLEIRDNYEVNLL
jgi:hypothetical protein